MALAERGDQPRTGLFGEGAEDERRGAGGGRDPGAGLLGLPQQRPCLVVERPARRGERDPGGGAVQQDGAEIGLQLFDGPAQRRLGHVQPGGGPAEVPFLGDGHEVAQRS